MFRYKIKYVIEKSLVTTLDIHSKVMPIQNPNDDQCSEYASPDTEAFWTKGKLYKHSKGKMSRLCYRTPEETHLGAMWVE